MSSIDANDEIIKFVDEQLKILNDKKKIVEWVDSRSLQSKRFKKRLIVLANYRILSIKKGKIRTELNKNISIYDISDIIVVEDTIEIRQKQLTKTGEQLGILIKSQKELLQNIIYNIREIHRRITHNFPDSYQLKINSPPDYLLKLPEKKVGIADNFIEIYNAQSNYRNTNPSPEVCRLVEKYVNDQVTDFDLTKCPGVEVKSELNFNMETLILSLKYNTYFQCIIINGVSQKNIISSMGEVIQSNCYIRKIVLSNIQEEQSLSSLGQGFAMNPFNFVQVLDLSSNSINQNTFQIFCEGLESLKHALKYLNISSCNLHGRSIELLFHTLCRNMDLSCGLEYFNLSQNKFEDIGSTTCCTWLNRIKDQNSLKNFYISGCGLNLLILGPALKTLIDCKILDISQNRLERTEVEEIISVLQQSKSLEVFDVSNCQLANEHFLYIANSISKNLKIRSISLILSNNFLGKNVNSLVNSFEFLSSIKSLDLSCNSIGYKGLTRVLDSLRKNDNIQILRLDQNFSGTQNEGTEFITELKNFINKKPTLRSISLSGGGTSSSSLSSPLTILLFDFLCQNSTIEELNISNNQMGDTMATYIANLFEQNKTLKSLEIDKNSFTINAFQTFLLSLQNNHQLVNIPFPTYDFEKSLISLTTTSKKLTLFNVFHRVQIILFENGTYSKPDQHFYPTPKSGGSSLTQNNLHLNQNTKQGGSSNGGSFSERFNPSPSTPSKSIVGNTRSVSPLPTNNNQGVSLDESLINQISGLEFNDEDYIDEEIYE